MLSDGGGGGCVSADEGAVAHASAAMESADLVESADGAEVFGFGWKLGGVRGFDLGFHFRFVGVPAGAGGAAGLGDSAALFDAFGGEAAEAAKGDGGGVLFLLWCWFHGFLSRVCHRGRRVLRDGLGMF